MIEKLKNFIQPDAWRPSSGASWIKRFFFSFMRIALSSLFGFMNDKGFDKASTLTFYSLLTIIPLLAIGFGIAQLLGFEQLFEEQVKEQFKQQPSVADKLVAFSNSTLKTTRGGIIASFGLVVLFWTVLKTIGNIAAFFNEIWKVPPRSFWQQVKSFVPLIVLFPLFIVGSSSAIVYTSALATSASQYIPYLSGFVTFLFNLLSYLVSWAFLSFLFIYLPNTKVSWKAGLIAGTVSGILFFLWQWIYVTFQLSASSYGAIYGSFAAVPLFLIWLNYSWLIVLFGAELTYQIQQDQNGQKQNDKA